MYWFSGTPIHLYIPCDGILGSKLGVYLVKVEAFLNLSTLLFVQVNELDAA